MKKLLLVLTATILAAAFAMPLNAAPMFVPKPEQVRANMIEKVKQKWRHYGLHNRNQWRGRPPVGQAVCMAVLPLLWQLLPAPLLQPPRLLTTVTIIRATTVRIARELAFMCRLYRRLSSAARK